MTKPRNWRKLFVLVSVLSFVFCNAPALANNPPALYAIYCDSNDTGDVQCYFEPTAGHPLYCSVTTTDSSGYAGVYIYGGMPKNGLTPVLASTMRFIVTDPAWTPYYFALHVNYTAPDGTVGDVYPAKHDTKTKQPTQSFTFYLQDTGVPAGSRLNYAEFVVFQVATVPVNVTMDRIEVNSQQFGKILQQSYSYCDTNIFPVSATSAVKSSSLGSGFKLLPGGPAR